MDWPDGDESADREAWWPAFLLCLLAMAAGKDWANLADDLKAAGL